MRDDVHVEVGAGLPGDGGAHPGAVDVLPGLATAGAEDDLGGVDPPGEGQERGGYVVADDVVEGAPEVLDEGALDRELLGRRGGQAVAAGDVHREDLAARSLGGHPGGAADERAALRSPGQSDDDALARLPGRADVVFAAVLLEVLVDPVGDPQERQLAQGGEVAGAEVVGQGGVDLVGLVDVAVGHAAPQRLGRHVDEFDLVRTPGDLVGDGLLLPHPGYRLHDVTQGLQVLDVDGGDHVDAGLEEFLDVLPALGVAGAGHVGVGEFVHERHGGRPVQDGVDVHLREDGRAVLDVAAPDLLQAVQQHLRARPVVVLHERDDAVRAPLHPAVGLGQHRVRLADAGCRTQVDPKLAACHGPIVFSVPAAADTGADVEATSRKSGIWGQGRTRGTS